MTVAPIQFTDQQAAAIYMRNASVGLSAGAGCGKTFVLTQRFLSHLEPGDDTVDLTKLVAITFTDKAAREMRGRIREECHRRLQTCPDDQVAHWSEIVRDLERARISTIHSFCGALLRTHAVEAGLDPGFRQLDDQEGSAVLRSVVDDSLLAQLEQNDEDAKAFVLQHGLEKSRKILDEFVRLRFRVDFDQWADVSREEQVKLWLAALEECWQDALAELRRSRPARDLLRLMTDFAPPEQKWLGPRRDALMELLPEDGPKDYPLEIFAAIKKNASVQYADGAKHWPSEEIYEQVRAAQKDVKELIKQIEKLQAGDEKDLLTSAECGLRAMRVARHAAVAYELHKQEQGLLDFDDLLLRTRNLLRDSEPVQRRATAGIELLMVDEFQDTDPVQADMVERLCGKELTQGKLFLVGDFKQSIYRFRRADPAMFDALMRKIPEEARLPLSENFRSQPAILNFVNALFAGEMGEAYEPLQPFASQLSPSPSIEFLWAVPDGAADEEKDPAVDEIRKTEADWIARRLHQLLHDGVPRIRHKNPQTGETELRPVQPGDIVILMRAMTNVRYYEQALREYGLDYYLEGGREFFAQQEVYDLTNLCRYLADREDEVSLLGILRSPFFGLRDETLLAMAQASQSLKAALENEPPGEIAESQQEQVRRAAVVLAELYEEKDRLPLHELLNLALERTGYDAALLAEHLGPRKLANLQKLIEMARQHERSGLLTLADFVERLQQSVAEEAKEEDAVTHAESSDVIRLMSIHKSKGLEFPVVVLADINGQVNNQADTVEYDAELGPLVRAPDKFGHKFENLGKILHRFREKTQDDAERIRLLYVATTRAADHLILSAGLKDLEKLTSPWMKLLADYFDLETGRPLADAESGQSRIPDVFLATVPEIGVTLSRPELTDVKKGSSEALLPLNRLREELEQAEPMPLPVTLNRYAPDKSQQRQFSVSRLEQIDAQLQQRTPPPVERREPAVEERPAEKAPDTATSLGTLTHAVLERLDFSQPSDIQTLVAECAAHLREPASEDLQRRAAAMVEDFLQSEIAAELRGARRLLRELEFQYRVSSDGEEPLRYLAGYIDCLYESAEGVWTILDYKTGRHAASAEDAEMLGAYELQLGTYALAARQLLGRLPDRVALALLDDGCRFVELPLSEEFTSGIESRLRRAIETAVNGV